MREMIQANKDAFSNLISQYETISSISISQAKRYIATSTEEKEWLKQLKMCDEQKILPSFSAFLMEFKNEKYFVTIGFEIDYLKVESSIIDRIELNAGILTVLLSENKINLSQNVNYLEFYDEIMFQHEDLSYKGHDFLDILRFLQPVQVFKIPVGSVLLKSNLDRIMCYVYANDNHNLILDFEPAFLQTISELALIGSDNISYGLILNSLLSSNYKHAFLELYRLVERLFPISYLKELHKKVNTELTFLEFSSELENVTKWKPKEEDAVEKIFDETKPTTKSYFSDLLNTSSKLSSYSDFNYFYKLRNSIVHFRANHEEFDLTVHQWNLLLIATLLLIDEHYSMNSKILN